MITTTRLVTIAALLLAAAAGGATAVSAPAGSPLQIQPCDAGNENQVWKLSGGIILSANNLCITAPQGQPGSVTLELQPCNGSPAQNWNYDPTSGGVFTGRPDGSTCLAWNTQGGPGVESAGSVVGLWSCSALNFNSYFAIDYPLAFHISANFTSPGNTTFSGLCVEAMPPPPLPVPTADQAKWQADGNDIACFVHFEMATMAGTQGCACSSAPPSINIWNPSALNTDQWIETGMSMGCSRFIYTAKHGCGFLGWNSSAPGSPIPYTYSTAYAPNGRGIDVVASFVKSARKYGVGAGFYYSVSSNALLNVCNGQVGGNAKPGQISVTQDQYVQILLGHLRELWGNYGPLAEIWFDGGYDETMKEGLTKLLAELQPHVVGFQAEGLMPNPIRWVGTEDGYATYPCWSTADYSGGPSGGDPDAPTWFPAETDFTLQNGDNWFYNPLAGVHQPAQLRSMVETSLGHNTALIIDIAPFPNGTVPPAQVAASKTLGTFMEGCYGAPIASTGGSGQSTYTINFSAPVSLDRVRVREDITQGQIVRGFTISYTGSNAKGEAVEDAVIFQGTSIGAKFITVLQNAVTANTLTLTITATASNAPSGAPFILELGAYGCNDLAARLDAEWEATSDF